LNSSSCRLAGVPPGPYFVLPFFGPSSPRDTVDVGCRRFGTFFGLADTAICFAVPAAGAGPSETMRETIDKVLAVLDDSC
jgi:hypothetical protein